MSKYNGDVLLEALYLVGVVVLIVLPVALIGWVLWVFTAMAQRQGWL